MHKLLLMGGIAWVVAGCDVRPPAHTGSTVQASGKRAMELAQVPPAVLQTVRSARPDFAIIAAEYETRDGREYFDVEGTLPDGSELEFDLLLSEGAWRIVEVQRDIAPEAAPEPVRAALTAHAGRWAPTRVIESDQGDGKVIYEYYGPDGKGATAKIEVLLEAGRAEVLRDEWQH